MLWLKVCIALLILVQFGYGQSNQQCKDVGQYCQLSSQCCQNLYCLSYSYKCVRSNVIQSTDSIGYQLINRFGDETNKTIQSVQHTKPMASSSTTLQISTNEAIPTSSESNGIANMNCLSNGNLCSSAEQCCSSHCSKLLQKCLERTESTTPEVITASTSNNRTPTCMPAGGHCYHHSDCCRPLICHGYAHKCVT